MKTQRVYKIQNKESQEFAVGGTWKHTTKRGKVWMGAGPLKQHLRIKDYPEGSYEIIEYELVEVRRVLLEDFQ